MYLAPVLPKSSLPLPFLIHVLICTLVTFLLRISAHIPLHRPTCVICRENVNMFKLINGRSFPTNGRWPDNLIDMLFSLTLHLFYAECYISVVCKADCAKFLFFHPLWSPHLKSCKLYIFKGWFCFWDTYVKILWKHKHNILKMSFIH